MDNLYKKIENELDSLSTEEREQILTKLRDEVDVIDREVVRLISRRTFHSVLIGRIKRSLNMPTYNPKREKEISIKISSYAEEPLRKEALLRIYERIIDESRAIQREELEKGNIFNITTGKMKNGFKALLSKKEWLIVISSFFLFLFIFYYIFFTPNYYKGNTPKIFEIKKGETLTETINDLYNKGIIPNKTMMKIATFVYGAEKKIRAARYSVPNGLSYFDLIDLFLKGKADFLRSVKIYNGVSTKWIASRLKHEVFIDSAKFVELSKNKSFLDSLNIKAGSLDGYLLPQKYEIYERSSPAEAIKIIYGGFNKFMNDSLRERAVKMGLTISQVLSMASIVEGETNKISEMPVIAGVYYNRLKRGMKLQADPTIQYLQPNGSKRLLYEDLKIDSPYNTYKYTGLPPGPINNPGKEAILAALYPDKNNYFFFVANGKGGHKFSKTYTEHLKLVNEYRKWLKTQKKN